MRVILICTAMLLLGSTLASAHEGAAKPNPTTRYWLSIYTGKWGQAFGMFPDKEACEAAAALYPRWVYRTCVPLPPAKR
jgi:hypothetical protein